MVAVTRGAKPGLAGTNSRRREQLRLIAAMAFAAAFTRTAPGSAGQPPLGEDADKSPVFYSARRRTLAISAGVSVSSSAVVSAPDGSTM